MRGCSVFTKVKKFRQDLQDGQDYKPNPANRINLLRHLGLRHALAIEVHFADAFDAREHVINRLAANAHKLGADDARYEIARKIENFLRRAAFEALAKNRGHSARERFTFGANGNG